MKNFLNVKLVMTLATLMLLHGSALSGTQIESFKAPFHIGSNVMICGNVAEVTKFSKGTYLNIGNKHPNQHITFLVWENDEPGLVVRFGRLETFRGQRACAVGLVEKYKNSLQIKVANPQFLRLMK